MATVSEKMTAIADAIRDKTGGTQALTLDDMANSVNEVYEAGKTKEWSDFWDVYQSSGSREDYSQAFSYTCWKNEIFKPKYQISPTNANLMFYRNTVLSGEIPEVISIDFSNCTQFSQTFQDLRKITRLGVIDLGKATKVENLFSYCSELITIDKIIMSEATAASPNFNSDSCLENVMFEGVITKNISFSVCPLTVESIKSVISCLKDYTETESEYSYTVTFLATAFEALEEEGFTEDDKLWLEEKGIIYSEDLTWAIVIDDMKWNLVKA